jgi:hypothetical protein
METAESASVLMGTKVLLWKFYDKAGGLRENIEGGFEVGNMLQDIPDND